CRPRTSLQKRLLARVLHGVVDLLAELLGGTLLLAPREHGDDSEQRERERLLHDLSPSKRGSTITAWRTMVRACVSLSCEPRSRRALSRPSRPGRRMLFSGSWHVQSGDTQPPAANAASRRIRDHAAARRCTRPV